MQSYSAQVLTIQETLRTIIQTPDMTIEDYLTKINGLWDEIDALDRIATCLCSRFDCQQTQKT